MIRKTATPSDWAAVHRICCETGNGGEPINSERHAFFGEQWTGPYRRLRPEWTYVATEPAGGVIGYLTGTPDTHRFRREKLLRFSLPLAFSVLRGQFPSNGDTRRFLQRTFFLDRGPEESFDKKVLRDTFDRFPAHLHINVRSGHRSGGLGARLIEAFLADLRQQGVSGVHLFCGEKPKPFYTRHSFQTLATLEFRPNLYVYLLGKKL
ncbi:MAG: GNAT family N-acetyltransferase [Oligoflexia bacterium]|nr:GNAT family N-acetyltransferase [Oligoflexia bacterium]